MARTPAITRAQYEDLFARLKVIPHPSLVDVSRATEIPYQTVVRAWNVGWPSRGWPAIKASNDGVTQKAKQIAAHVLAKADPTAFPLALEDEFVLKFNQHLKAGEALALARGISAHAKIFESLEPLATAVAEELTAIAVAGLRTPFPEFRDKDDEQFDPFERTSRAINLIERLTKSLTVLQQGVRLHLGLPNEIVQHEIADESTLLHRLTLADKLRARLAGTHAAVESSIVSVAAMAPEPAPLYPMSEPEEFDPAADIAPDEDPGETLRLCIAGGPKTGKSTLARQFQRLHGIVPRSTDDVMNLGWSEASDAVAMWFDEPGPWVIEGVAVPRALRKWLRDHPDGEPPCDEIRFLEEEHVELSAGQATMAKGVHTVWNEILPDLERRGVVIV